MDEKNKAWEDMRVAKEEQYFAEQNKLALEKFKKSAQQSEQIESQNTTTKSRDKK